MEIQWKTLVVRDQNVQNNSETIQLVSYELLISPFNTKEFYFPSTLRRSIIVPGGANNEYRGGPGGPGTGFCGPGGGFLILVAVVACLYFYYHWNHPQDRQNHDQDHPLTRY